METHRFRATGAVYHWNGRHGSLLVHFHFLLYDKRWTSKLLPLEFETEMEHHHSLEVFSSNTRLNKGIFTSYFLVPKTTSDRDDLIVPPVMPPSDKHDDVLDLPRPHQDLHKILRERSQVTGQDKVCQYLGFAYIVTILLGMDHLTNQQFSIKTKWKCRMIIILTTSSLPFSHINEDSSQIYKLKSSKKM